MFLQYLVYENIDKLNNVNKNMFNNVKKFCNKSKIDF